MNRKLGEISVLGIHFSTEKRDVLTGRAFGHGIRGAERERLSYEGVDCRLTSRVYFYIDKGRGVFPEAGVGNVRHEVQLCNLYDAEQNPMHFRADDFNEFETSVLDAGFSGYCVTFSNQGVAVVLGDHAEAIVVPADGMCHG